MLLIDGDSPLERILWIKSFFFFENTKATGAMHCNARL